MRLHADVATVSIPRYLLEDERVSVKLVDTIVQIPPGETLVGDQRLSDLRACYSVSLPLGLSEVGEAWFAGSGVREVVVPASVRRICGYAFKDCARLGSVVLAPGSALEEIGAMAFCGTGLEQFVFPSGVRKVGREAFCLCRQLREVVFAEGLQILGESCFSETGLVELTLPASLREIGARVFRGCE